MLPQMIAILIPEKKILCNLVDPFVLNWRCPHTHILYPTSSYCMSGLALVMLTFIYLFVAGFIPLELAPHFSAVALPADGLVLCDPDRR